MKKMSSLEYYPIAVKLRGRNARVGRWGRKQGSLVNVVDAPALSDFISPALFRQRQALVTVYSDGKDPVLSGDLKNFLKGKWDEFLLFRHRPQKRVS